MSIIGNEKDFRRAIRALDDQQQRLLAARFVEHVLALCRDRRIAGIVKTAADSQASPDELAAALQTAHTIAIDHHTRCGSECDWQDQAGYFVARAAVAALTPVEKLAGASPAIQAAVNCRMAQTSESIAGGDDGAIQEAQDQYRILSGFLQANQESVP